MAQENSSLESRLESCIASLLNNDEQLMRWTDKYSKDKATQVVDKLQEVYQLINNELTYADAHGKESNTMLAMFLMQLLSTTAGAFATLTCASKLDSTDEFEQALLELVVARMERLADKVAAMHSAHNN